MTKREFNRLVDAIKDLIPDAVRFHDRVIIVPVGSIVRGLLFGRSEERTAFYPYVFFVPLFVPTPILHVTFGSRLRTSQGTEGWYSTDPNLVPELRRAVAFQALPLLKRVDTDAGVLKELEIQSRIGNPYAIEAFAYALVRAGDRSKALKALDRTRGTLVGGAPWERSIAGRCDEMEHALNGSIEAARKLLERWERDTRAQLAHEWTR